jgi:hypothetical protein
MEGLSYVYLNYSFFLNFSDKPWSFSASRYPALVTYGWGWGIFKVHNFQNKRDFRHKTVVTQEYSYIEQNIFKLYHILGFHPLISTHLSSLR